MQIVNLTLVGSHVSFKKLKPFPKKQSPALKLFFISVCSIFLSHSHTLLAQTVDRLEVSSNQEAVEPIQSNGQAKLICDWLSRQELKASTIEAMKLVVSQHFDETSWAGKDHGILFAIVVKQVKSQSQAKQKILVAHVRRTHSVAVHELLTAKSLLDAFGAKGLNDATTLRRALAEAKLRFEVKGNVRLLQSNSQAIDSHAISYVLADESQLTSHLTRSPQLETVQASYREVIVLSTD